MGVGPPSRVRSTHTRLAGKVGQGSPVDNVLIKQPILVDGAAVPAVLAALPERDAVLPGEIGQQSAGEAGEGGDLLEPAVLVEVKAGEDLFRHFLAGCEADASVALAAFFVSGRAGGLLFL